MSASHLNMVDTRQFRELFVTELGWNNPDRPDQTLMVDGTNYLLQQVASFKGLRVWFCAELPDRKTQRELDELIGQSSHERLVIFARDDRQEWRWPRRAQLGGANAKLLVHQHLVGEDDAYLQHQLETISIDFDTDISLVELLSKMRVAFDAEAESASVTAARLMGTLYAELSNAGSTPENATLLLARLLFLLFGDDSGMWRKDLFLEFIRDRTTFENLRGQLALLFDVLDTPETRRQLPSNSPLAEFRYINGGLFAGSLTISPLTEEFRTSLLQACAFDWAIISPAIFGSMFQTVKDKSARRQGGEHYTTEPNILKTIRPLFLDDLRRRLVSGWNDKALLTKLHNELGSLRFLDPACGCGNFLIVSYRELRALELELLLRRRDLDLLDGVHGGKVNRFQLSFDVSGDIKVTLDHFYGIEIEEWPARIAETAMLLVDHLANQRMEQDFGFAPDRLPIKIAPTIHHGSALDIDWSEVCPIDERTYILGNPPFYGARLQVESQRLETSAIWRDAQGSNNLDYVANWYLLAARHIKRTGARAALVSTNSITQGEQPAVIWGQLSPLGIGIDFAHRTFAWDNEAAVHTVIIGFSNRPKPSRLALWTYATPKSEPVELNVAHINGYLVDAPDVFVTARRDPITPWAQPMDFGSMPNDGGFLSNISMDAAISMRQVDPIAARYLRPIVGARELIHNEKRFCLWLVGVDMGDIRDSPELSSRVDSVRALRQASKREATRKLAARAAEFGEIRQPVTAYIAVPKVSSEARDYVPIDLLPAEVIATDLVFVVKDGDLATFGLLASKVFSIWNKAVSGRLKSDTRISNTITYNNFPFPAELRAKSGAVAEAAQSVLDARAAHDGSSLADLYDRERMPADLRRAHSSLDEFVLSHFDLKPAATEEVVLQKLFDNYATLSQGLLMGTSRRKSARRT